MTLIKLSIATAIALAFGMGSAMAVCPHTTTGPPSPNKALTNSQIKAALGGMGKYHCAVVGNEKWNETLGTTTPSSDTGPLTDYKRGPSDATDRTEVVGTWSISTGQAPIKITYDYGGGNAYEYTVSEVTPDVTYELCNNADVPYTLTITMTPSTNPTSCL